MNTVHWHLALNHVPIIGTVIGTFILTAGFIFRNNSSVKRVALSVLVLSAFFAIPVYLTGEGAEEIVEKMPGVTENIIEKHEDLGKIFLILIEILGALALITFIADWAKNRISSALYVVVLVAAFGVSVFGKQVGSSGGEIRHTEIRNGIIPQGNNPTEQKNNSEKGDE